MRSKLMKAMLVRQRSKIDESNARKTDENTQYASRLELVGSSDDGFWDWYI